MFCLTGHENTRLVYWTTIYLVVGILLSTIIITVLLIGIVIVIRKKRHKICLVIKSRGYFNLCFPEGKQLFCSFHFITYLLKLYTFFDFLAHMIQRLKWALPISYFTHCRSSCVNISLKRKLLLQFSSDLNQTWYILSLGKCASNMCSNKKFDSCWSQKRLLWG